MAKKLVSIKDYIKTYPNWPVDGVDFKDTSSLCNSDGIRLAHNFLYNSLLKYKSKIDRILIVGYGSIGKRHLRIARKIYPDSEIKILTKFSFVFNLLTTNKTSFIFLTSFKFLGPSILKYMFFKPFIFFIVLIKFLIFSGLL